VKAIQASVLPSYNKLLKFMREEYVPKAREALAAESLPNGKAYYQSKIVEYTTTSMSADEIHNIGLAEMAKIRAEMQQAMKPGRLQGRPAGLPAFLRSDPQFYAKTPDELLMRAAWIAKKFDGKADQYFGYLPRRRFAIVPVPPDQAPYYTSARGGPGVYLVNTYNLPARALYSLPALTLHESAPGHAFQMPVALEQKGVPPFRRAYISAYGEGWALYSNAWAPRWASTRRPTNVRHAELPGLARGAPGGRHRHPRAGLDPRTGAGLHARQHGAVRARNRDRGRPLHLLAGPGAVVLPGRDGDHERAQEGRGGAGRRSSISAPSTTPCCNWARCRCRCWRRVSTCLSRRS
jgi:hypothetical protein